MTSIRITLAAAGLVASSLAFSAEPATEAKASAAVSSSVSAPVDSKAAVSASKKSSKASAKASVAKSPSGPGRMQVEEPKGAAPISSARESKAWQKNHARGLTDAQKQAFRERKDKMEGMIAVIKEKRKALKDAKPEERAALARELHSLMLEKEPSSQSASVVATARVAGPTVEKPALQESAPPPAPSKETVSKNEAAQARRQQRIEAYQAQLKKLEEARKQQAERYNKSGNGNDKD